MNADVLELVKGINERYDKIQSLTATMDFAASVGGAHRGAQTDYTSSGLYSLPQAADAAGVIMVPVLHTDALDLASNGNDFTLLISPQQRSD